MKTKWFWMTYIRGSPIIRIQEYSRRMSHVFAFYQNHLNSRSWSTLYNNVGDFNNLPMQKFVLRIFGSVVSLFLHSNQGSYISWGQFLIKKICIFSRNTARFTLSVITDNITFDRGVFRLLMGGTRYILISKSDLPTLTVYCRFSRKWAYSIFSNYSGDCERYDIVDKTLLVIFILRIFSNDIFLPSKINHQ